MIQGFHTANNKLKIWYIMERAEHVVYYIFNEDKKTLFDTQKLRIKLILSEFVSLHLPGEYGKTDKLI